MKKCVWVLVIAIILTLMAGCSTDTPEVPQTSTPATTQPTQAPVPDVPPSQTVDLAVFPQMEVQSREDVFYYMEYPVLELGYEDMTGRVIRPEVLPDMEKALTDYNADVLARLQTLADNTAAGDLSAQVYILRNDTRIVSFYEELSADADFVQGRGFTYDTQTGKELTYRDVFARPDQLAQTLADALKDAYPEENIYSEQIAWALEQNGTGFSFTLTPTGVLFYGEPGVLCDEPVQLHIPYDGFVNPQYAGAPDRWMIKPAYDKVFALGQDMDFRLQWALTDDFNGTWTAFVGDKTISETLCGYRPDCYLFYDGQRYFLYMTLPAGDISSASKIYELTPEGFIELCTAEQAIQVNTSMNPDRITICINDVAYPGNFMLQPWGWYKLDPDGMPQLQEGYGLFCRPLVLGCDVELRNTTVTEATAHNGTSTVYAGQQLRPFRSDLYSYLDFLDEDGNAYRLEITDYGDGMYAPGYPALEEMFS